MDIDQRKLDFYILKKRLSTLFKALSIFHFVIGVILIITISGSIWGILSMIAGFFFLKLNNGIPDIEDKSFIFFKNLWIIFIIYTISFSLNIILIMLGIIFFFILNGFTEFLHIFV